MFTGHIAKAWKTVYEAHVTPNKLNKRWTSQLIVQLLLIAWDLWSDRNNIKHHTETAAKRRETALLNLELREELRQGGRDIPHDGEFFQVEEAVAIKWNNPTKKQFLSTLDAIRQAHAFGNPTTNDGMDQERGSIRNWLQN